MVFFVVVVPLFIMASKEIKLMQCHCLSVPTELVCQVHSNVGISYNTV